MSNHAPMLGSTRNGGTRRYWPQGQNGAGGMATYQRRSIRQAERRDLLRDDDLADTMADAAGALLDAAVDGPWVSIPESDAVREFLDTLDDDDFEVEDALLHAAEAEAEAREERIAELARGQFDPADVQWGFTVRAGVGFDHGDQVFGGARRPGPSTEDLDADHRFIDA